METYDIIQLNIFEEQVFDDTSYSPEIGMEKQKELINKFNKYLNKNRKIYNSLFLTNYRESNNIARKRISFLLAFKICSYLLE